MQYTIQDIQSIIGAKGIVVENTIIENLVIDSRKIIFPNSSLFFALHSDRRDGHTFIEEAYQRGVRNFVVEKYFDFKILRDKPIIPEDIWLFNYLMYDNAKNQKLFDVAQECGIKKENIQFTCMESKSVFLKDKGFIFHLDDDDIELMDIFESNKFDQSKCFPIHVDHFEWKETCKNILKKSLEN